MAADGDFEVKDSKDDKEENDIVRQIECQSISDSSSDEHYNKMSLHTIQPKGYRVIETIYNMDDDGDQSDQSAGFIPRDHNKLDFNMAHKLNAN